MNIFIYGDESGVFDYKHNDFFVFGGIIFLSKQSQADCSRKYIHAERQLLPAYKNNTEHIELKAAIISNKHRSSLFRLTNNYLRYAFVIDQQRVNHNIFQHKKSKQCYLDYVYKVGLKAALSNIIDRGLIIPDEIDNIYVRFDEHTTATNGKYELKEAMEEEFRNGTYNFAHNTFHKPLFPNMKGSVHLEFKNSANDPLIRASDIIANRAFYAVRSGKSHELNNKLIVVRFP